MTAYDQYITDGTNNGTISAWLQYDTESLAVSILG